MTRKIALLGSTGSIGRQSLEVIEALGHTVTALTANQNVKLLEEQCRRFRPRLAVCMDPDAAAGLKIKLADTAVEVASGMEGLLEAAALEDTDTVLTAVMGMVGLKPTLAALELGRRVALANKETLVCAGELVMETARRRGGEVVPVDSEHSAIFQCLQGCQALNHPNWSMGAKITVDSATMMNKGLEVIEAMRLYRMPLDQISVVIHRESIIHSLVEYCDNAILAQLGTADMRLPIQYALTWPDRVPGPAKPLDLLACPPLTFQAPDSENFPCLALAMEAARTGGTATAVLNGANEAAVGRFLAGEIGFGEIPRLVERALETVPVVPTPTLDDILSADADARRSAGTGSCASRWN